MLWACRRPSDFALLERADSWYFGGTDKTHGAGAEYDGRPVDYALSKFLFFECSNCQKPYFGGRRECGAGPGIPTVLK